MKINTFFMIAKKVGQRKVFPKAVRKKRSSCYLVRLII